MWESWFDVHLLIELINLGLDVPNPLFLAWSDLLGSWDLSSWKTYLLNGAQKIRQFCDFSIFSEPLSMFLLNGFPMFDLTLVFALHMGSHGLLVLYGFMLHGLSSAQSPLSLSCFFCNSCCCCVLWALLFEGHFWGGVCGQGWVVLRRFSWWWWWRWWWWSWLLPKLLTWIRSSKMLAFTCRLAPKSSPWSISQEMENKFSPGISHNLWEVGGCWTWGLFCYSASPSCLWSQVCPWNSRSIGMAEVAAIQCIEVA